MTLNTQFQTKPNSIKKQNNNTGDKNPIPETVTQMTKKLLEIKTGLENTNSLNVCFRRKTPYHGNGFI